MKFSWRKCLHYGIYLNFVTGFLSALYMVFIVYKPPGHDGPLWQKATELPHDFLIERRMYALEAWVIFVGMAIYFALTTHKNISTPPQPNHNHE